MNLLLHYIIYLFNIFSNEKKNVLLYLMIILYFYFLFIQFVSIILIELIKRQSGTLDNKLFTPISSVKYT